MKTSNTPSFPIYFPYMPDRSCYALCKTNFSEPPMGSRPVPPQEKWISEKYGKSDEEYLASGKRDTDEMMDIVDRAGISLHSLGHVLEFGCGDGRMIRWLEHLAADREVWGTDIDAERVFWCKQHLSPPFHFITTTTVPHLPFEDRYFGFIFAGSVFTHIDDLADSWICELRRILRPGGRLFITVHLKNDIALLNGEYRQSGLGELLNGMPEYREYSTGNFDMFTIGRSSSSYVFYDLEFFRRGVEPMFRVLSVTEGVRLYQNALLLERL